MKLQRLISFVHEQLAYSDSTRIVKFLADAETDNNNYTYISTPLLHTVAFIKDILKTDEKGDSIVKTFCDIGCGVPVIPNVMNILGYEAYGLEIEKLYCTHFRKDGTIKMLHGDMTIYNFKDFDYLYSYNPIRNSKLMNEALVNVLTTMKKGATLYFNQACAIDIDFTKYGKVTKLKDEEGRELHNLFKIIKK